MHFAPARALMAATGAFLFLSAAPTPHYAATEGDATRAPELSTDATNVLATVLSRYGAVTNVSCTVRRAIVADGKDGGSAETVSRIVWARGNRLNAQKLAPDRRRTVIDGETVRTAAEGDKTPVSFPVAEQLPSQAANLRAVPASPEEALAPLDPATGRDIKPVAEPYARQVLFRFAGTNAPSCVAVVSFDAGGCVARLEAFDDETRATRAFATEFSAPVEPVPGLRLFRRIETVTVVDGRTIHAISSYDRLRVNGELPPSIFDPKAFF